MDGLTLVHLSIQTTSFVPKLIVYYKFKESNVWGIKVFSEKHMQLVVLFDKPFGSVLMKNKVVRTFPRVSKKVLRDLATLSIIGLLILSDLILTKKTRARLTLGYLQAQMEQDTTQVNLVVEDHNQEN